MTFKAVQTIIQDEKPNNHIVEMNENSLDSNLVQIEVHFSSLNYKDLLSSQAHKGITRDFPHTPGIDAAGMALEDHSSGFKKGDQVAVIGFDFGMNTNGGWSQKISVKPEWVFKLKQNQTLKEVMQWGTSGFTAAYSVEKLMTNGLVKGRVAVTGASGAVGVKAALLLKKLGFEVTLFSRKKDHLKELGFSDIRDPKTLLENNHRALLLEEFDGAVDTLGGEYLIALLKKLKFNGSVTCCGMIADTNLQAQIFPFILRGINLLGVASADASLDDRIRINEKISKQWQLPKLNDVLQTCVFSELPQALEHMSQGTLAKPVLVDVANS